MRYDTRCYIYVDIKPCLIPEHKSSLRKYVNDKHNKHFNREMQGIPKDLRKEFLTQPGGWENGVQRSLSRRLCPNEGRECTRKGDLKLKSKCSAE